MSGYANAANLAALTQAVIASAQLNLMGGPRLSNYFNVQDVPAGANAARFPVFSRGVTAGSYAEDADYSSWQDIISTSVTIEPERLVSGTLLYDKASHDAGPSLGNKIGQQIAEALIQKENDMIWSLFPSLTLEAVGGGTTTNVTEAILASMKKTLNLAGAKGPFFTFMTEHQIADLITSYGTNANVTATAIRDSAVIEGIVARIMGTDLVRVINLPDSTVNAASTTIAMCAADCIGVSRLGDVNIEFQKDISKSATEILGTLYVKANIINPILGVKCVVDNNDAA